MIRRSCVAALSCVTAAVGLAACGSSDGSATTSTKAAAAAKTAAVKPTGTTLTKATVAITHAYTGGRLGKADASLTPVKVGFTTQLGSTPSFPEQLAAAKATTKLINTQLGGIDGHPLTLDVCTIQTEEDGQKCGSQFLNHKDQIVDQALAVVGNKSLYDTVIPKVPVLVGTPSTGPDSATKGAYTFTGGGPAVIYAIAKDIKQLGARHAALLSVNNPGGQFTMQSIAIPALKQLGVGHGKVVYYDEGASTPDIVSALQAAGGGSADAIFFDPSAPQECLSLYNAMQQLGIHAPVVTTPICNADVFVKATAGGGPTGWRFWGFGTNPRVTSLPQVKAYLNTMQADGQSQYSDVGFATSTMRDLLTIARFGNELGAQRFTAANLKTKILDFRGPAFLAPGPENCAKPLDKTTISVCGTDSIGSTFTNGKWTSIGSITDQLK